MTARQFVIETLRHDNINRINFRYGPVSVYPVGYSRDVAKLVEDGHILFDAVPGAHYTVDTRPGERHRMALPAEHVERGAADRSRGPDALDVKAELGQLGGARFRGTIVHEATHALQDYQRNQTDARTAEGAAYLAGWMASLLWGYPRLPGGVVPTTGHAYARRLAADRLDGRVGYVIPEAEVRALGALVETGAESRYVFNGI